jgi:hypothetical protein
MDLKGISAKWLASLKPNAGHWIQSPAFHEGTRAL